MDGPICDPWDDIELLMDVREAMAQLTDKQREALALWVEGYTQAEIGERLGIGKRSAGHRLEGAVTQMRKMLVGDTSQNA